MLDEEWLTGLRFVSTFSSDEMSNIEITGLNAIGSSGALLFNALSADGHAIVLKLFVSFEFACYVHELSPRFCIDPRYSPARLNEKLLDLVGDPALDEIVDLYDRMYRGMASNLADWQTIKVRVDDTEADACLRFIIQAPGVRMALSNLARDSERDASVIRRVAAIESQLDELEDSDDEEDDDGPPLWDNPLYVWGGAITEGYFPGSEMDQAIDFIWQNCPEIATNGAAFLSQSIAVFTSIRMFTEPSNDLTAYGEFHNRFAARYKAAMSAGLIPER